MAERPTDFCACCTVQFSRSEREARERPARESTDRAGRRTPLRKARRLSYRRATRRVKESAISFRRPQRGRSWKALNHRPVDWFSDRSGTRRTSKQGGSDLLAAKEQPMLFDHVDLRVSDLSKVRTALRRLVPGDGLQPHRRGSRTRICYYRPGERPLGAVFGPGPRPQPPSERNPHRLTGRRPCRGRPLRRPRASRPAQRPSSRPTSAQSIRRSTTRRSSKMPTATSFEICYPRVQLSGHHFTGRSTRQPS